MAEAVPSFINLRSTGNSGHITRYIDGTGQVTRFLAVWTDFDRDRGAYVYGKAFNADGTPAGDHFLIDYVSGASYRDITAETLSDGRTVVAWIRSDDSGPALVGKVLSVSFVPSGELLELSQGVDSEEVPQLYASEDGGFTALYRGSYIDDGKPFSGVVAHTLIERDSGWTSVYHSGVHEFSNSASNATITLKNGRFIVAAAVPDQSQTVLIIRVEQSDGTWKDILIDMIPGVASGINPAACPLANGGFVVAWEDVENNARVIRTQIFDSNGQTVGAAVSFTKPNGILEGTPVIKQLANGGFAIAFVIKTQVGEESQTDLYTAAVDSNNQVIVGTTYVGTNTAGDQWDPSLVALTGNDYAVSWQSSGESGAYFNQYIVEVIGRSGTAVTTPITPGGTTNPNDPNNPNNPGDPTHSTVWNGTNGNDAHTGTAAAEVLKGFGGRDIIDGGSGNDKLWGGLGNDSLKGGGGLDIFVFDTKPNKSSNKDNIADFKVADDTIWLDNKAFTKLGKKGTEDKPAQLSKSFFTIGSKAKDKNDYVIYDKAKGVLSYDADGSGKGKAVEIATLSKKLAMTYKDFFVI